MAIIKEIKTTKGPVSYWVIGLVQIDNFAKSAFIKLLGFHSQEYAEAEDAAPLQTIEVSIYPDKFDEYFGGTDAVSRAYGFFKKNIIESVVDYDLTDGKRG